MSATRASGVLAALASFLRLGRAWPVRRVPSSLDMRDDTPVWVRLDDGTRAAGVFRGAAPDGSYAVRLEGEPGCLRAFDSVELR